MSRKADNNPLQKFKSAGIIKESRIKLRRLRHDPDAIAFITEPPIRGPPVRTYGRKTKKQPPVGHEMTLTSQNSLASPQPQPQPPPSTVTKAPVVTPSPEAGHSVASTTVTKAPVVTHFPKARPSKLGPRPPVWFYVIKPIMPQASPSGPPKHHPDAIAFITEPPIRGPPVRTYGRKTKKQPPVGHEMTLTSQNSLASPQPQPQPPPSTVTKAPEVIPSPEAGHSVASTTVAKAPVVIPSPEAGPSKPAPGPPVRMYVVKPNMPQASPSGSAEQSLEGSSDTSKPKRYLSHVTSMTLKLQPSVLQSVAVESKAVQTDVSFNEQQQQQQRQSRRLSQTSSRIRAWFADDNGREDSSESE